MSGIGIKNEFQIKRVAKAKAFRDGIHTQGVENYHVRVMPGNSKTGQSVFTVSLIPVLDCKNCGLCKNTCYDVAHDLRMPSVIEARAVNSAIHKYDNARYWDEISANIVAQGILLLRINVGGDMNKEDFPQLKKIAERHTRTQFLFFTKNTKELNEFLDKEKFPENVKCIVSRWDKDTIENIHNLPESHLLYTKHSHEAVNEFLISGNRDLSLLGTTSCTYKKETQLCGGNCTRCYAQGVGCWTAKNNSDILLIAH